MPLSADWKIAKTAFETTTGKKKPSEKFLGFIRKGTGVEAALKDVDGAKTAADLKKSLLKFNAAYTAYLKQLDSSAADPKAVPAADKPAYVAAIDKLRTELKKIEAAGEAIGKTLGDAGGKEKVDANALKEADAHLKLREQGAVEAAELVKTFKAALAKADSLVQLATKQVAAAKQAGKTGNTAMHMVAVGVIEKCLMEVEPIARQTRTTYKAKVTDNNSTLMKARMDPSTDKLPESVLKTYLPKSKAAFNKMSAATAEVTSLLKEIENKIDEVKGLRAEAEGAGSTLKDSKTYADQLGKLLETVQKEHRDIATKADRVIKGNEQVAGIAKNDPETQRKWYRLQEDQWKRYEPDVKNSRQRFASLLKQAVSVPAGAREDGAVDKAVKDIEQAVKEATDYLDTAVLAGQQLVARIRLQLQRLG